MKKLHAGPREFLYRGNTIQLVDEALPLGLFGALPCGVHIEQSGLEVEKLLLRQGDYVG